MCTFCKSPFKSATYIIAKDFIRLRILLYIVCKLAESSRSFSNPSALPQQSRPQSQSASVSPQSQPQQSRGSSGGGLKVAPSAGTGGYTTSYTRSAPQSQHASQSRPSTAGGGRSSGFRTSITIAKQRLGFSSGRRSDSEG